MRGPEGVSRNSSCQQMVQENQLQALGLEVGSHRGPLGDPPAPPMKGFAER